MMTSISRLSSKASNLVKLGSRFRFTKYSIESFLLPISYQTKYLSSKPEMNYIPDMFCRQCEQASGGVACTSFGTCGKSSETASSQDFLLQVIKNVSACCVAARKAGISEEELRSANVWSLQSTFSTLTNVNFSESRIADYIREGIVLQNQVQTLIRNKGGDNPQIVDFVDVSPNISNEVIENLGSTVSVLKLKEKLGDSDDSSSMREIATAALKGTSAYALHCFQLGFIDESNIIAPIHEAWLKLSTKSSDNLDELLATVLKIGEINATTMALLDNAHKSKFGTPEPSQVRVTSVKGKAMLVSGHDLNDLYEILRQTEGTGINVYTHGEMLPAHAYPELKKFPHLVGNYGTAWQNQKFEFAMFPGPIIMTTNCVTKPRRSYRDRLYTMNEVGLDGVQHIVDGDISAVMEQAKSMEGFDFTVEPPRFHTAGFHSDAILSVADEVRNAIKSGDLSRIFLIGGCDGTKWDRNYFTDLAKESPSDSIILTLGCAKNRIIHEAELMSETLANGIPRVLDMGQCNDAHSAIIVAQRLAKELNCEVNDLPLSFALSHMEQKSAAVLSTLLHLGVKNIRLGPTLPAYLSPNVLSLLQENYNLMPTGNAYDDLKLMMNGN